MENVNSVEIVDYDERMRIKLAECDRFFNGKDAAIERVEQARIELENAESALAEYDNAEYVEKLTAYREYLKHKLGVVEPVAEVAEAHDEQVVEQCAVAEVAGDEIVEQPLL